MSFIDTIPDLDELRELQARFAQHGHELWFVGGCVRDYLKGETPKDIDLATSATPDEALTIYCEYKYSFIETSLSHGTITVVINHNRYEITSYRIDRDHDGRYATVEFTRSLREDLMRRDLTINAMAMDFNGNLYDPFGGRYDLHGGTVRFVGSPEDRLNEDYLRILRWFRFYGRFGEEVAQSNGWRKAYLRVLRWCRAYREFGNTVGVDPATVKAIITTSEKLQRISVERIWIEIAKIISGRNGIEIISLMGDMGVMESLGLPRSGNVELATRVRAVTDKPAMLMAAYYPCGVGIGDKWKWSKEERRSALFMVSRNYDTYDVKMAREDVFRGIPREWVSTILAMTNPEAARDILEWPMPMFPVTGKYLISLGWTPGRGIGRAIKAMVDLWVDSEYTLTRDELIELREKG